MIEILPLVKITVLLGIAAAFLPLMRRATPGARHFLCIAALNLCLLLPVFLTVAPVPVPGLHVWTILTRAAVSAERSHPAPVHWLQVVWLAGVLAVAVRFLVGLFILQRRARLASAFSALPERLESLLRSHGVTARLAPVASPVVWGWLHPEILLPESSRGWPEERLRLALLHELAHVHRGDLWTGLIAAAAQAVYWFHPLVWWLCAKAAEAQELACDDSVLADGASAPEYAFLLLETARRLSSPIPFGCPMVGRSHSLRGRIMHILQFRSQSASARRTRGAACVFPALLIGAGLLMAVPDQPTTKTQDKVYKVGGDVTSPVVTFKIEPEYTAAAKDAKIQGSVLLWMILDRSGVPHDIRVSRSLDPGLDQNAIHAIQQWRFRPATKEGKPVSVSVNIEVNFRLK